MLIKVSAEMLECWRCWLLWLVAALLWGSEPWDQLRFYMAFPKQCKHFGGKIQNIEHPSGRWLICGGVVLFSVGSYMACR